MSYLLNYKNWRAIHESMLFEAKGSDLAQTGIGSSLIAVEKGNAIYDISVGGVTSSWGWLDQEKSQLFSETLNKTIGFGGIPQLFIYAGVNGNYLVSKTKDVNALMDIFKLLICGIGRYHNIKNLGDEMVDGTDGKTAQERVEELGLIVTQDGEIQMYGPTAGSINASSDISLEGVLDSTKPVNKCSQSKVLQYLNTFNLINFAEGNSQQYSDIAACLDDKKVLQLGLGAKGVSVSETALYLYSPKTASVTAASREERVTTTQGKAGLNDSVNLAFTPNEFATATTDKGEKLPVNGSHPMIQDVADKILAALGEDQQITKMTLVSGASPDWQGNAVPESNGSGDPSGGKLSDATFKTEKTALGNQWLAWRRGKQFADALTELLGEKRIAANALTIEWKVSKDGAQGGRNLSYLVGSTGVAPKDKTETVFAGASYKVGGGVNTFYRYKFTWNYANIAQSEGGWLKKVFGKQTKSSGDVKVKDIITYREMVSDGQGGMEISKKKTRDAEVIRLEDGVPVVKSPSGKDLIIKSDRFVSGGTQTKAGKVVEE